MNTPIRSHRFLPLGDYYFGGDPIRIQTVLGTCICITLWHPSRRLGGMCHYLLPSRAATSNSAMDMPGVYATEVMELFDASLRGSRTQPSEYIVKLFGGGCMFPEHVRGLECRKLTCTDARRNSCPSVGCKNISVGRQMLTARGYAIAAQDVGGDGSRQVVFDVPSGDVWVRQGGALGAPLAEAV